MSKKLKIGIIGLGTVGTGVVKVLSKYDDIEIVSCAVKNLSKKREVEVPLTDDIYSIVNNPEIDVVVEVAGGVGVLEPLKCAIKNNKHIVTANKELLARHGAELFDLAREYGVSILYEAAVAGGIPIIMPIKTSLKANDFELVAGILNGTTNYILTKMESDKISYEECLARAQELGYAETDPTGDVEGFDAMYKIAILANIVFNKRINLNDIYREGITKITAQDIEIADELGYKIKLIAMAKKEGDELDIRVHPMLVDKKLPISEIKNATNAVFLKGHPVDRVMFTGPGAGEFPTASSVAGDILAIKAEYGKCETILPMMSCNHNIYARQVGIENTKNCYYLSITASNKPGIIGKLGNACAKYGINISYIIQKGTNHDNAKIIVVTEECYEKDMTNMIKELEEDKTAKVENKIRVM
ncbi:MAG: homoserine dehydrogenase [Candidatus Gastranaerophilales bacterium]|nr:homoserine dehydrogenase [Candidatus Gastranaerophilales bacterium]